MPFRIILLIECERWVHFCSVLVEVAATTCPLPVGIIEGPVCIQEIFVKSSYAQFPVDKQVSSGEEAGHELSATMMDPAFLLELAHRGVDGRVPSLSVFPSR